MSNVLAKIARSIFWPLYATGCWVCLVIFEGVLGLSVALGVRVAVNKVMGSRGRRNRSHRRWGQYSHGQRNWPIGMAGRVNGAMRYPAAQRQAQGPWQDAILKPHDLCSLAFCRSCMTFPNSSSKATSLLQRFAGGFWPAIPR